MSEKSIQCNFEVMYPVNTVNMSLEDFNNCLGILVDNAIEEAEMSNDQEVNIIISKQEKCLTIIVENKLRNPINCHDIWEYGYSTKGNNRGIGLFSYKKIIEKYPNAFIICTILIIVYKIKRLHVTL